MTSSFDNIKVAIRIRPLIAIEKEKNLRPQWKVQNNNIYQIDESAQRNGELYSFDHIFDMDKSNAEIYESIVQSFVDSSLNGLNSTIFAYGQTSSGKTYTMLGDENHTGIMSLAIKHIFDFVEKCTDRKFLLRVSYIEIYNEKINDLLDPVNKDIKIREFFSGSIGLQSVKEEIVSTREQVYKCLQIGTANRRIAGTNINERSSRSHTIFKIEIESAEICDFGDKDCPVQISNLNLVDLAGSERVAQTKATGVRLREGGHINKSLSALALVIRQLSDGQEYVNFRDSKLTRLLQHSLGGNAKTLIIATITLASIDNTNSTLSFAQRAKAVKNKPQINEILTDAVTSKRYAQLNAQLKKRLDEQLLINKQLEHTKEENFKEISRLHEQMQMLDNFQHGKTVENAVIIPKRRHTIGYTGRKYPLRTIMEQSEESGQFAEDQMTPACQKPLQITKEFSPPRSILQTVFEETPAHTSETATPKSGLKARIQALEEDYNELITYTRDEKNIFTEISREAEDLKSQLQQAQKNLLDIKSQRKFEEEYIVSTLKKQFKRREQELVHRIDILENILKDTDLLQDQQEKKDNTFNNNEIENKSELVINKPTKISSEESVDYTDIHDLHEQLLALQNILNNSDFDENNVSVGNSMHEIIESFNLKTKTSKEIIESEILKQIKSFNQINERLNELIVLPNELDSFNNLLSELSAVKNDIPADLIIDTKGESVENLKFLIMIYESLLKKNELIGRCSEKVLSLQEQIQTTNKLHDQQVHDLRSTIDGLDIELTEKDNFVSEIEDKFTMLKNEVEELQDTLKKKCIKYESKIASCQTVIREHQFENSKLKVELHNIKASIAHMAYLDNESLKSQTEEMQNTIQNYEKRCEIHDRNSDILHNRINDLETELNMIRYRFEDSVYVNEKLKLELQKQEQFLVSANEEIANLKTYAAEVQNRLRESELVSAAASCNADELPILLKQEAQKLWTEQNEALVTERDELKAKLEIVFEENRRLNLVLQDFKKFHSSCGSNEMSINNQLEKIHELETLNNSYLNRIQSLEDTIDRITIAVGEYENKPYDNENTDEVEYAQTMCRIGSELQSTKLDANTEMNKTLETEIAKLNKTIKSNNETIETLTRSYKEYENKSVQYEKIIAEIDEKNKHYASKVEELQNENNRLKSYEKETEKLHCDISEYETKLSQYEKQIEVYLETNKHLMTEMEELKTKITGLSKCEKMCSDLTNTLEEKEAQINEFHELNKNLKITLCKIIEQFLKEEKTLLLIRHAQEQRDQFKNIKKELKSINENLKIQHQSIMDGKTEDLNKICETLIESNTIMKQYSNLEKTFLQSQLSQLDLSNQAYLQEITVLKEFVKNGCPNCDLLKDEISQLNKVINSKETMLTETLAKLRDLQEKLLSSNRTEQTFSCLTCSDLKQKNSELQQRANDQMAQIVDLQVKFYEEQEKQVKIQHSELMKYYQERDKVQRAKIEKYESNVVATNNIEVQCDILEADAYEELQKKYNLVKRICQTRKDEIANLKRQLQ